MARARPALALEPPLQSRSSCDYKRWQPTHMCVTRPAVARHRIGEKHTRPLPGSSGRQHQHHTETQHRPAVPHASRHPECPAVYEGQRNTSPHESRKQCCAASIQLCRPLTSRQPATRGQFKITKSFKTRPRQLEGRVPTGPLHATPRAASDKAEGVPVDAMRKTRQVRKPPARVEARDHMAPHTQTAVAWHPVPGRARAQERRAAAVKRDEHTTPLNGHT